LKVAINFHISSGPTGGGNSFVIVLRDYFHVQGHTLSTNLEEDDLDLIIIMDPRRKHQNMSFNVRNIVKYIRKINSNVIVVHRINECDERKNTRHMNDKLRAVNYIADSTIYVGSWLKNLNLRHSSSPRNFDKVILNGSDPSIYNPRGFTPWSGIGPIKLVTHHWSANLMKGWDIYSKIDSLLSYDYWRQKFSFTYVGNLPEGVRFQNSSHVFPKNGMHLAKEISSHHGYLTASINEPGGNHQNEGALCGLPLLYRDSGCMPEYCSGYGLSFNESNIEVKLIEFYERYNSIVKVMPSYPHTSTAMAKEYVDHFEYLLQNRDKIVSGRNLKKNLFSLYRLYFPI
jgi:hypothetical protein